MGASNYTEADDERTLLAGLMELGEHSPAEALQLMSNLRPEYFLERNHQVIFKEIQQAVFDERAPDEIYLARKLSESGDLAQIGGASYLATLDQHATTTVNLDVYAQGVRDFGRKSMAEQAAKRFLRELQKADTLDEGANGLIDALGAIMSDEGTSKSVPLKELIAAEVRRLQHCYKHGYDVGISSGFESIADLIPGWQNGSLNILAARPSMGKTALASAFAVKGAESSRKNALFFSLEMSKEQIAQRGIAAHCKIQIKKFTEQRPSDGDFVRLSNNVKQLADVPVFINPSTPMTVPKIRAEARRLQATKGLGLVVVDYLQIVTPNNERSPREQQVAQISRDLKSMAKILDVPVIALAQLNRGNEDRADKRPVLSDIRESGQIEQDADTVMFLHQPDYYKAPDERKQGKTNAELIVAKNRNGRTGVANLSFDGQFMKFTNGMVSDGDF